MMNELIFKNNDEDIYCRTYVPDTGHEKYPTVIICHGFNGSYVGNVKYAELLCNAGYACVLFDFPCGSMESRSGGDMMDMTVSGEVKDLTAVTEFTLGMEFTDREELFLMGKSQGGLVSAIAAAKMPDRFRALVLLYPAFTIPYDAAKVRHENGGSLPEKIELLGGVASRKYMEDAIGTDISVCFDGWDKPTLILHGDSDPIVPVRSSIEVQQRYKDAELVILENAVHGFGGETGAHAEKKIEEFLEKNRK